MADETGTVPTRTDAPQHALEPTVKERLALLLAIIVICTVGFNALFAFSAFDGSRILAEVADDHGVPVEGLKTKEHYDAVNDRYYPSPQATVLYWFGPAARPWAAISVALALWLAWVWRRRGWLIAIIPLAITVALMGVVLANSPAVGKIAAWME